MTNKQIFLLRLAYIIGMFAWNIVVIVLAVVGTQSVFFSGFLIFLAFASGLGFSNRINSWKVMGKNEAEL